MADLIDRQVAIKEAYKIVIDGDAYEVVQVETLMGLPSADAVVRCKDCRHYGAYRKADDHTKASIEKYGLKCVIMQRTMFPYNYCCFGDRGNDNERN